MEWWVWFVIIVGGMMFGPVLLGLFFTVFGLIWLALFGDGSPPSKRVESEQIDKIGVSQDDSF